MKIILFSHHILSTENQILRLILFCIVLLFFFCSTPVTAHVEKGTMPDSVAEMEYRILLEFEPDNLEIRIKLGMILYRSDKFEAAENEFNYVLKKDPENIDALTALARVNIRLLNYKQAVALFRKAIAINPDDMHIYYYLGQTMEMQGNLSGAEDVYEKGLSRGISSQDEHAAEARQALIEALNDI
jgi:tetratricopeptide (TPR) repeat protein